MSLQLEHEVLKIRVKKAKEHKLPSTQIDIMNIIEEETEKLTADLKSKIASHPIEAEGDGPLSHLGEYIEEPYAIIESYFRGQHLDRLVRHQIESYNHFINCQIAKTIQMFNPVNIRS